MKFTVAEDAIFFRVQQSSKYDQMEPSGLVIWPFTVFPAETVTHSAGHWCTRIMQSTAELRRPVYVSVLCACLEENGLKTDTNPPWLYQASQNTDSEG